MPIVNNDTTAVRSEDVAVVSRPTEDWLWYVTLTMHSGVTVTVRVDSVGARDEFYKLLVDAMGQ